MSHPATSYDNLFRFYNESGFCVKTLNTNLEWPLYYIDPSTSLYYPTGTDTAG